MDLKKEIERRRTFAIISHPDAGKTTITEQILYQGGVVREAGQVKGKPGSKTATSDWMTMEKDRGVSITSSVMPFELGGLKFNLLDTPGHKDFGEDTYRTLMAADSAAMLIDAAKGVEKQTQKLYEVCRLRKMPIFTFANKVDQEGKNPLEIIDDVEKTLGMKCYPMTWPIGMGGLFEGLFHRGTQKIYLYKKGSAETKVISTFGWEDEKIKDIIPEPVYSEFIEDMELLSGVLEDFNKQDFLDGKVSPMSFGSAKNNWGVDLFLDLFTELAPPPLPRKSILGEEISPFDPRFSGFVFKIQANMDRKHRDRMAFVRICSGSFERGMKVKHIRLKRDLRLAYVSQFFARDRSTLEKAYSGDIIGVTDTGHFQIGDTITSGHQLEFPEMPRFSPEVFAKLSIKDPLKRKQMQKAIKQLAEEGSVQLFFDPFFGFQDPILGVVGELQFDVLLFRLNDEYKLDVKIEKQHYQLARWSKFKDKKEPVKSLKGLKIFMDIHKNPVVLLQKEWDLRWLEKENPDVEFLTTAGF